VLLEGFGEADVMHMGEVETPRPGPGQVLIRVAATSVNRPDLIQRRGHYPPPPGDSEILGLEVAGTVEALGPDVDGLAPGARVFALIGGGGYAEYAVAHAGHTLPIPESMSFEAAACICETYITAYLNLFRGARLTNGETALLHGGGGGVNTAGIQLVKALAPESPVIVTASTHKIGRVAELGADCVIDYRNEDFAQATLDFTARRGADVILDHIGAGYFEMNLKALAVGGRLLIIATMSGRKATLDLARLMVKRQSVMGSVLRPRPIAEKAAIIADFAARVMPLFADGRIAPLIHTVLPLEEAAAAHRLMEGSEHFGKIVLTLQ
jgi:putative PIG3 family NAD(P)H quinone oxidoreductase